MLEGLKVIELASVLAGPAVGMFFAELGAEVIKIEAPEGDITRKWKLPSEDRNSPASAYFSSVNWGKTHRFIDLRSAEGQQQVHHFLEEADVLIVNFKKGDALKFGLDYAALKARYPRLIYTDLKGFDSEPQRVSYDVVLQAETGYMAMNGTPDSGPLKMPLAFMDLLAAHQMKEGVLLALYQRERNGKGSRVSVSLEAAALAGLANQASNWLTAGHVPQRLGSLHPNIAPYGEHFATKDGKTIVLAIGNDKQYTLLCRILGKPEWAKDNRFRNNQQRVMHRKALAELLESALKDQNSKELMRHLVQKNVPAGVVKTMPEVFENPVAREMILEQTEEDGKKSRRVASVAFQVEG